jgi:hypothetical protein
MKNKTISNFPSLWLAVGRSGSGKSTVIQFLLSNPNFLGDFFDEIYLVSPTAELDDITDNLKIDDDHIITDPTPSVLEKILEDQKDIIKSKGIKKAAKKHKIGILFDDIIAAEKFLKSGEMVKMACMSRHFLVQAIIATQSYTKIPRAIRLQSRSVIFFPSNQDEVDLLVSDFSPPHVHKQTFREMVEFATKEKHDFLYINMDADPENRFRKTFRYVLRPRQSNSNKRIHNSKIFRPDVNQNDGPTLRAERTSSRTESTTDRPIAKRRIGGRDTAY